MSSRCFDFRQLSHRSNFRRLLYRKQYFWFFFATNRLKQMSTQSTYRSTIYYRRVKFDFQQYVCCHSIHRLDQNTNKICLMKRERKLSIILFCRVSIQWFNEINVEITKRYTINFLRLLHSIYCFLKLIFLVFRFFSIHIYSHNQLISIIITSNMLVAFTS